MEKNNIYICFIVLLMLVLPVSTVSSPPPAVTFSTGVELQQYISWHPDREPLISAHRGGPMRGFPENALETFQNILHYGPCLIECDVRFSKDGHLVMMHDDTLDRTSTGSGRVNGYSLALLKQLYLKDPAGEITAFRIPTFAETLDWAVDRAILTVDVKRGVPFDPVIRLIKERGAEGCVIVITYNLRDAETVHRLAPDLVISAPAIGVNGVEMLLASRIPARNLVAFVGITEPNPMVYEHLHQNGIRTVLSTMNNLDNKAAARGFQVYSQLYGNGADILSSDNVPMVSEAIKHLLPLKGRKQ